MATPRAHLAPLPPGFITVRIFQLVGALIILALTSFVTANVLFLGELITLPSAVLTLILVQWMITAENCAPKAYNYWAILAFEIFMLLLWADALGWMIFDAVVNASWFDCSEEFYNYCSPSQIAVPNVIYAAAAFTTIMFILFLTSLIVVSISISRHRAAGGHNKLGSAPTAPLYATNQYQGYSVAAAPATLDLQQQNLALQQQYLTLQQQHLELQRRSGITTQAPVHMDNGLQSVGDYPEVKGPTAVSYS